MSRETFEELDSGLYTRKVGMLWQRLRTEPLPLTATIKPENTEMAMRIAEALSVVAVGHGEGAWVEVEFTPRPDTPS